jgi:peptidoglycan-N-acetylglucosamine deacetylase
MEERGATAPRTWVPWALGGAGVGALVVIVAVVLYLTVFTVSVNLDGKSLRLRAGTTAGDLFSEKLVVKNRGDVVSAKESRVLERGKGGAPFVSADGHPLASATVLTNSLKLTSHDGTDSVESTRITTEPVKVPTRYVGSGPVQSVVDTGVPGVRRVEVGAISGEIVSKRQVVAPIARVVRLKAPSSGAKTVALTFDDGPWPGSTEAILKILKKYGVKATFFEIGRQARQRPSIARKVADAGMEMGNHSETHPLNLGHLSASGVSKQITEAQHDITKASGKAPKFFRPPGGNTTSKMYPVLSKLHLGWVQWDIDTDDWKRPSVSKIVSRVTHNIRPGAVVLMHDGGGDRSNTVKALPKIIEKLQAEGYVFVTVDQLEKVPHRMG